MDLAEIKCVSSRPQRALALGRALLLLCLVLPSNEVQAHGKKRSSNQYGKPTGLKISIDESTVPALALTALEKYVQEVKSLLPPHFQYLSRQVNLKFKKLDQHLELMIPPRPGMAQNQTDRHSGSHPSVQKLGYVSSRRRDITEITLSDALLSTIGRGPENAIRYAWGHGNLYRLAQAVLIHELAHIYDFANLLSPAELTIYEECQRKIEAIAGDTPIAREKRRKIQFQCNSIGQEHDRTVSDDDIYKDLSGFIQRRNFLFFKKRQQEQALVDGGAQDPFASESEQSNKRKANVYLSQSPDNYEYSEVVESFAVNLEFFLLDPTYACRRPSLYRYFILHFAWEPFSQSQRNCEPNGTVLVGSSPLKGESMDWRNIHPDRVYQVHYLLAGKGKAMMSRWGHAMFRLVICAPGTPFGPGCLMDRGHHLVVSYRAAIETPEIDSLKGLTGAYPSRLYLLTLAEVIEEYTLGEFRDVESYPLNLTPREKEFFVLRTLEQYWDYSGQYYFISNNCATESMKLLRTAGQNKIYDGAYSFSPLGMLDDMIAANVINPDFQQNPLKYMSANHLLQKRLIAPAQSRLRRRRSNGAVDENPLQQSMEKFLKNLGITEAKITEAQAKQSIAVVLQEKSWLNELVPSVKASSQSAAEMIQSLGLGAKALAEANRFEAIQNGMLWPSLRPVLENDYQTVRRHHDPAFISDDLDDYILSTPVEQRKKSYVSGGRALGARLPEPFWPVLQAFIDEQNKKYPVLPADVAPEEKEKQFLQAKEDLVNYFSNFVAEKHRENVLQFTVRTHYLEENVNRIAQLNHYKDLALEMFEKESQLHPLLSRIWQLRDFFAPHSHIHADMQSYGLPLTEEVQKPSAEAVEEKLQEFKQVQEKIENWTHTHFRESVLEIDGTKQYLSYLQLLMRGWLHP